MEPLKLLHSLGRLQTLAANIRPGVNVARVLVPGKLFQLSLMFVGKAGAYSTEEPSDAPI